MPSPAASAPPPAPPRLFDRVLHRRRLDRAARDFHHADFLHRRAAEDVADRLSPIMRTFPLAVDLSARRGAFAEALTLAAPEKVDTLIEADLSARMLAGRPGPRLVADEERLPFAPASLDLIVSVLGLHWTNDVVGALIQARQALRPDGLFIAALLGGVTLTELRQSLVAAEIELLGGAGSRISPFADARDAAGLLQRAGFVQPVADVDTVRVTYDHPLKLLYDLRRMGETNALADRHPRPLTRALLERTFQIYVERFADSDGRIPATFEILTLTGWAPPQTPPER
jgi:SAM-dependent methyltransferase